MSSIQAPGNYSSQSHSYAFNIEAKRYPLLEAIEMVGQGLLPPLDVYTQLPGELQEEINNLVISESDQSFARISLKEQRFAFQKLKIKIDSYQKIEAVIKNNSPLEALKKAQKGEIDDLLLLNYLSKNMQGILDDISLKLNAEKYNLIPANKRMSILETLIKAIEQASEVDKSEENNTTIGENTSFPLPESNNSNRSTSSKQTTHSLENVITKENKEERPTSNWLSRFIKKLSTAFS